MDEKTVARFWAKVDKRGPDDCWLWTAVRMPVGYGKFWHLGKTLLAHRFAMEASGASAEGMIVCHRCDNPPCVNPAHLFLGTYKDNRDDMVAKGRAIPARGAQLPQAVVSETIVSEIRKLRGIERQKDIGARWGISQQTVSEIMLRKIWRHVA